VELPLKYKIAVGTRDGKVVSEHFGSCVRFTIIEADPITQGFEHLEIRDVNPPCKSGEHHENGLDEVAGILSDCRVVLVSRIGPGAEEALTRKGIDVLEYSGWIDEAVNKIIQYYK
jgi:predicted Fe-Mo cluster-binding NifX family protein